MEIASHVDEPGKRWFRSPYWREVKRPVYAIWVVLPMLAFYEIGLTALQAYHQLPRVRNGADVLIQLLLGRLGIYGSFISLAVVVGTLVIWQACSRQSWHAKGTYCAGVLLEAVVYAFLLVGVSLGAHTMLASGADKVLSDWRVSLVFSFGAGVYEEYLFRLLLVPLAIWVLRHGLDASKPGAVIGAAVISGLLFSASHHMGAFGHPFNALAFTFRAVAGIVFAFFFLARGFAVTSLTHALYDVGVTLVLHVP